MAKRGSGAAAARPGGREGTRSIRKAVGVLRALATGGTEGLRLNELLARCSVPRPTLHRILGALVDERLVTRIPGSERYALGSLAYELGLSALPGFGLREICAPFVEKLAEHTGDTAFLTLRRGLDGVCIDRRSGSFPIKTLTIDIGVRRPLGVGLGSIAILGALAQDEREAIMRANAPRYRAIGAHTADRVRALASRVNSAGFGATAGDFIDGVGGFAVVIRHPVGGRPFAALSVASLVSRMPPARGKEILPLLRSFTRKVETAIAATRDWEEQTFSR
ncbi:MAG TPA: IclR family transcriptional regulator [Burkholderiales bacterium]|nr:IclR family transcriptional regulator [Burkholderiales bacterium]